MGAFCYAGGTPGTTLSANEGDLLLEDFRVRFSHVIVVFSPLIFGFSERRQLPWHRGEDFEYPVLDAPPITLRAVASALADPDAKQPATTISLRNLFEG